MQQKFVVAWEKSRRQTKTRAVVGDILFGQRAFQYEYSITTIAIPLYFSDWNYYKPQGMNVDTLAVQINDRNHTALK